MKKYISIFKIRFINSLQYKTAALAGISTQVFFGIVFISVYLAFYESNNTSNISMNWKELVSYLWLNQIFFSLILTWTKDRNLISIIKNGNIAYEFIRPINLYHKWFATMYANRLANVLLRFLPATIIAFIIPQPYSLNLPYSILSFLTFIISLIISSLVATSFQMITHLLTIYTLDEKGIMTLFMVIGEIFSGGTVPIVFFPNILQKIAYLLPFRYICDLPFRIYSGNIKVYNAIPDLLNGILWIIVLFLVGIILSKKATKKAIIQGG